MQIKQVFSAHSAKDKAHQGQFEYCPFCGSRLAMKENGGRIGHLSLGSYAEEVTNFVFRNYR